MPKLRRIAVVAVLTVAAIAVGLWLLRDQPRRIVQAALAERLGAEVSVGSLHLESTSSARLGEVGIRMPGAPGLEEIRVTEIIAHGALGDVSRGRFRSLRLVGVEVIVDPAAGAVWPTAVGPQVRPEVARLEIAGGRVTVLSPEGDSVVEIAAEMNDVGVAATGTLRFSSDRLQLDPLLRLVGVSAPDGAPRMHAEGVAGELVVAAGDPRLQLEVRTEGVSAEGWPALTMAELEGTLIEETPGLFRLTVSPLLPSVAEARLEATLAASPWRVTWLRATARGLDAAAWSLPELDSPRPWSVVGGTIDLEVSGEPTRGLSVDLAAHGIDVVGAVPVCGDLAGHGEVRRLDGDAWAGRIELGGRLARPPSGTAPEVMLDAVLPATLATSVELGAGGRSLSGSIRVATAAVGAVEVVGAAGLGSGAPVDARWTWNGGDLGGLLGTLVPDAAASMPGSLVVTGEVTASGRLGGDTTTSTVTGEVLVRELVVHSGGADAGAAPAWRLQGERPVAHLAWTSAAPSVQVDVPETRLTVTVDPLDPLPVVLRAAADFDLASGSGRIRQAVVDAGSLGSARFEASWPPAAPPSAHVAVRVDDLAGWPAFAAAVLPDAIRDARATGRATLELEASRSTAGWSFTGPLEVTHAGLSAVDGSRVVEGLEASARVTGVAGSGGDLEASAVATLGGFQLLWGTHYADFSDRRAALSIDGIRRPDGGAALALRLELAPHAALTGSLDLTAGAPSAWSGSLTVTDIGELWETYVEAPFEGTLGGAAGLRFAGGELQARLRGAAGEAVTAKGEIRLAGLSFSSAAGGLDVERLQLQLPVDLRWTAGGGVQAGEPQRGLLAFDRVVAGGVQLAAIATELAVLGDSVTMVGDLQLPVLGGEVVLERAGFADLARSSRHLTAAVGLNRIRLAEVSRVLGLPPLSGDVTGGFPQVLYSKGILTVDGTGELAVFGGTVTMRGITGADLLTRYPRLKLSADWRDIDLAQVTRTFDFGTMSGIVEGELVDCEIFRDVPVRFRGRLQSVPREGVKQRISLKAVNNIAIVGTGSGLGFLDSGLRRFIDSYAYRGIGLEMALSQDRFLLRGLERRGDRELFVKGRFPLRLDVVNVDPGMTVSFRTMIQRLRALDVTTVTTEP